MIRFYRPDTGRQELEAIRDPVEKGALSTGEYVGDFERAFADFCGRSGGVAVASGSVALELALDALDIPDGGGILVSPFNCSAVIYAIERANLAPVFADISLATLNLCPDAVRRTLDQRDDIVAALLTPSYGLPEESETVDALESHDLTIVNDCCQTPGATVDGTPASTRGRVAVCSFGATKNLTTGEGGMVLADDAELLDGIREQRTNSGVDRADPPTNVRMSDIEAAMGLAQLERYPEMLEQRCRIASIYREELPETVTTQSVASQVRHVYHRFPVLTNQRSDLQRRLSAADIEARPGITKLLSEYAVAEGSSHGELDCATTATSTCLLLPMHSCLDDKDARRVATCVRESIE